MLEQLSIKNLAVVESLSVDFQGGMTVVTGETGKTSAPHQVPDQLPHTFVTELLVPPTFSPEYLLVVGQAVSQPFPPNQPASERAGQQGNQPIAKQH